MQRINISNMKRQIKEFYKKEQEKILAASPHGERIKADAQAAANYHKEIARIESLKIKEKEKDYLKAKAENDLEKTKISRNRPLVQSWKNHRGRIQ